MLRQLNQVPILDIHHLVRVAVEGERVRGDGDTVRSATDHERRDRFGCDQGTTAEVERYYRAETVQLAECLAKRSQRVFLTARQLLFEEMGDDLRVRLGFELVTPRSEAVLQVPEVLDDAVMNDRKSTGLAKADLGGRHVDRGKGDLAGLFLDLDHAIDGDPHTPGIVSTIFEELER